MEWELRLVNVAPYDVTWNLFLLFFNYRKYRVKHYDDDPCKFDWNVYTLQRFKIR